ncbi:MAG: glycosyltransferase [Caulobacterales bacterium]|nr:glycosyltransferase [Caulobacterales bacterium]
MIDDEPTVSIIVPSIESAEILKPHLQAVQERTGGNCELVLVGRAHGLTDAGLRELGFSHGRVIEDQDRSHPHAINLGMMAARGRSLVWMNADDLPTPALMDAARLSAQDQTFVLGEALRHHSDGSTSPYGVPASIDLATMAVWCPVAQPACLIPSSALSKAGLLDPALNLGFDYEYWIRALKAGMRFQRVDEVLAEVTIRPDAKSFRDRASVFVDEAEIHRRHFGRERPTIYEAYWSECSRPAFGYDSVRRVLLDSATDVFGAEARRSGSAGQLIESDARLRLLAQGLKTEVDARGFLPSSSEIWIGGAATAASLWIDADADEIALMTDEGVIEAQATRPGAARLTWHPERNGSPSNARILIGSGTARLSAVAIGWSQRSGNGPSQ